MKQKKKETLGEREQRLKEAFRIESAKHKEKLMPFVKFLRSKGLQFDHARVQGNRIEYFRMDQYEALIQSHRKTIEESKELRVGLEQEKLINLKRPEGDKKVRYPSVLQAAPTKDKFAAFPFQTNETSPWTVLMVIAAVVAVVLFPIWPYTLKYSVWLISLWLLIILVSLILLRLLIYILCLALGINLWIFPYLMTSSGFLSSFTPFYHVERWEKSSINILFRLFGIFAIAYLTYVCIWETETLWTNFSMTQSAVNDLHDWGVLKINGSGTNFSARALTNLQTILNETADPPNQPIIPSVQKNTSSETNSTSTSSDTGNKTSDDLPNKEEREEM